MFQNHHLGILDWETASDLVVRDQAVLEEALALVVWASAVQEVMAKGWAVSNISDRGTARPLEGKQNLRTDQPPNI